ncbi:BTB And Kelch [Ancylostoma caninum]|uniref:BTB And Kelch n=1 Tax=Ancylostoma caninum TaxID=29170 RepID=A0A368FJP4_ANCCA|nr:BTB And Kelch [Ancylostoma caninum]
MLEVEQYATSHGAHVLDDLSEGCETFLVEDLMDENNALSVHKLLVTLNSRLGSKAEQYVKKNFSTVAKSEEFLKMSYEDVKILLSSTDLHISSEREVFHAAMRWIEHCPERTKRASRFI